MELSCPKCESPMRSFERSGVTVDQCTGCRGVFLDRGELERLIDQEGSYYEERSREPRREEPRYEKREHPRGKKRHKRENFLGELFDF